MLARWLAAWLCAFLAACGTAASSAADERGNVLLVVMDDVGQDMLAAYGWHPEPARTPTIDALAARGVVFANAYGYPYCTPSRAAMLTGRFGFRTGVGVPLVEAREFALRDEELTLAELARDAGVATALVGKWHLGINAEGACDPRQHGFEHFRGAPGNLQRRDDYSRYVKLEDGEARLSTRYPTSEQVDDALELIAAAREPWFVTLAFNAAHQPFHAPPSELHSRELAGDPDAAPREHYLAAVEALDRELGRLLATLDARVLERTTVIVVGDNGSPNEVVTPPVVRGYAKGTLFEAGIRVPLIAAGRGVSARGKSTALASCADLFPTIAGLLGVDLAPIASSRTLDGVDLRGTLARLDAPPPREVIVSELFWPNGPGPYESSERVIRDARWKLWVSSNGAERLFDLDGRVLETSFAWPHQLDGDARRAYERLQGELARMTTR